MFTGVSLWSFDSVGPTKGKPPRFASFFGVLSGAKDLFRDYVCFFFQAFLGLFNY